MPRCPQAGCQRDRLATALRMLPSHRSSGPCRCSQASPGLELTTSFGCMRPLPRMSAWDWECWGRPRGRRESGGGQERKWEGRALSRAGEEVSPGDQEGGSESAGPGGSLAPAPGKDEEGYLWALGMLALPGKQRDPQTTMTDRGDKLRIGARQGQATPLRAQPARQPRPLTHSLRCLSMSPRLRRRAQRGQACCPPTPPPTPPELLVCRWHPSVCSPQPAIAAPRGPPRFPPGAQPEGLLDP